MHLRSAERSHESWHGVCIAVLGAWVLLGGWDVRHFEGIEDHLTTEPILTPWEAVGACRIAVGPAAFFAFPFEDFNLPTTITVEEGIEDRHACIQRLPRI